MNPGLTVLLVLLLLAAGVLAWWLLTQRTKKPQEPAPREDIIADIDKPSIDQLKQLQLGDVVHYESSNWFVRGSLHFDEQGYVWNEYLLDDATSKRWLSLEDDESFEVSLWHALPEGDIEQGTVGDRDIIVGGVAYRLQEQGTADFTASGATGTQPSGSVKYADYKSVDGKLLGFENYGTRWEPALGEVLQPWELTVFPSTDRHGTL